jgi:UDP-glucose 4,6-dehydratase
VRLCLRPARRYFICDKKLAALGWVEKVGWEDGLRKTVDWYLENGFNTYWENGDVEQALKPHPGAAYVVADAS